MVKFLTWLVITLVAVILLWTILGDITPVTLGLSEDVPQKWVASGFFVVGLLLGWLFMLPKNLALRWTTRQLRKENTQQKLALDKVQKVDVAKDNTLDVPPLTM